MNAATHGTEVNASAPVLYMALELSNKTWRLALSDGVKPVPEALLCEGFRRAVLAFLAKERAITGELHSKMLGWRYCGGFSAHNRVRVEDREGRMKLAEAAVSVRQERTGSASSRAARGACAHLDGILRVPQAQGGLKARTAFNRPRCPPFRGL